MKSVNEIKKIGVIGAGTMGGGIAQVFALYDYPVILVDTGEAILQKALEKLKEFTDPDLWDKVSSLIVISTDLEKLKDCDLIIEAVFEDLSAKKEVFKSINSVCNKTAIITTNTSSISINKLAAGVADPSRFIGMHFMNPPKVMKLVEIIRGEKTSEETVEAITELTKRLDKIPAVVNDSPGFVSNRLLFTLIGEAIKLFEKGVATKEDIDTVMKYGMNHPMGPIKLADFIGLDVCLDIMQVIYDNLNDDRYKPSQLLETLVRDGKLGRKTGEGFYKYA
ncbi:MAG: 3-hydroxyacyl-CoA dehydrogenase family protein [Candidatus Scalinduaceae bacterium]